MSDQKIKSGGGAVVNGNVDARDFIGRDQINVTYHNSFTKTVIRHVIYRPSLLYWALLFVLIGLYVSSWLVTSEVGIKTNFTKPLDRLFYELSANNLGTPTLQGTNGQTSFVPLMTTPQLNMIPVSPTNTIDPTSTVVPVADTPEPSITPTPIPSDTSTPTLTATPNAECTAKGDLALLDRNMWPPQSLTIGVNVPNGTKVNPIAWDNDQNSPWIVVVYSNQEGWYSANLNDPTHFECENIGILPIRTPLPPIPPTQTNTPTIAPSVQLPSQPTPDSALPPSPTCGPYIEGEGVNTIVTEQCMFLTPLGIDPNDPSLYKFRLRNASNKIGDLSPIYALDENNRQYNIDHRGFLFFQPNLALKTSLQPGANDTNYIQVLGNPKVKSMRIFFHEFSGKDYVTAPILSEP